MRLRAPDPHEIVLIAVVGLIYAALLSFPFFHLVISVFGELK